MYRARRRRLLGHGQGSDRSALLAAAGEAATQLVESVAPAIRVRTITAPPRTAAQEETPPALRSRCHPLPAPACHGSAADATTTPRRTHE
ncbi:MAG TPA: hypothetical protein VNV17_05750 [Solirubrobacteraceae bacterium]|nr:hypothetical protein [Solirubrobacteraceae bacterium]